MDLTQQSNLTKEPLVPPRKDDTWAVTGCQHGSTAAGVQSNRCGACRIQDEPASEVTEDTCGKSEKESWQNQTKTRKKTQPCPHGRRSKHVPPVRSLNMNRMVRINVLQAAGLSHPTRGKVTPSQWKRWFSKKSPHREKVTPQHRF